MKKNAISIGGYIKRSNKRKEAIELFLLVLFVCGIISNLFSC